MPTSYIELKCRECEDPLEVEVKLGEIFVYPCACVMDKASQEKDDIRDQAYEQGEDAGYERGYDTGYADAQAEQAEYDKNKETKDANIE